MHLRDRLAPEVAEMVYYGFWYHAKMDALLAFIREAQKPVTGEVTLNLYKGNIIVAGRTSPNSLYDEGIASMEGGGSLQPDRRRRLPAHPRPAASACKAASRRGSIEESEFKSSGRTLPASAFSACRRRWQRRPQSRPHRRSPA